MRPLLPGSAGCLVVVTSRSALAGLAAAEGARPLRLGPLGAEEGVRLLAARLGPERVAAEPGAVTELISRCGHLPLALAVMAARAAADRGLPLGVLAGRLAGAADAEAAAAGGGAGPGRWRCWRPGTRPPAWASCCPGRTASWRGRLRCSRWWGCTAGRTSRSRPRPAWPGCPAPRRGGRWPSSPTPAWPPSTGRAGTCCATWFAAAAGVAQQVLGEAGIRAAVERSVDHYLHTGYISCDLPPPFTLAPPAPGVLPEKLPGEAELQDWAQANQQVQLQAIAQAAAAGLVTRAWQMFFGQAWSLGGQGYWADCLAIAEVVLAAAEAAGDQVALGWTHAAVGRYGTFTGAHDEDRADLARALDHFRRAGDLSGQAYAHLFTSGAYTMRGDLAEAIVQSGQALALFRQTGDQAGQGWALATLGACHAHLGDCELARGYAGQAMEVTPETGDPTTLAMAWHARAFVHSSSASNARRSAVTGRPWTWWASGSTRWPAGCWSSCWPSSATSAGLPGTCLLLSRPGSRPCRSSATWAGRTCWESAAGSSSPGS